MENTLTFLTDKMVKNAIGKEVKLIEDLYNTSGTRRMKKEKEVGTLVMVVLHCEEATVKFGNRKHRVDFSKLVFNNIEDEMFIKNEEAARQERKEKSLELIAQINKLVDEHNEILKEVYGEESQTYRQKYQSYSMASWVEEEENSEYDVKCYEEILEYTKNKLEIFKKEMDILERPIESHEVKEIKQSSDDNVVNFENKKVIRGVRKLWTDFESKSPEQITQETYMDTLYYYTCGQSGRQHFGWLKGVEYMMDYIGMDYMPLRAKVLKRIQDEGRTIINKYFFEDDE